MGAQLAAASGGTGGEPPDIEDLFIAYASQVKAAAVNQYNIPIADAQDLVSEVFLRYLMQMNDTCQQDLIAERLLALTATVSLEYRRAKHDDVKSLATKPPAVEGPSPRARFSPLFRLLSSVRQLVGRIRRRR